MTGLRLDENEFHDHNSSSDTESEKGDDDDADDGDEKVKVRQSLMKISKNKRINLEEFDSLINALVADGNQDEGVDSSPLLRSLN